MYVELLIIDEAERLTPVALEMLCDRHDRTHLALILIGMPGIDRRFCHYPQLYSQHVNGCWCQAGQSLHMSR